MRTIKTRHFTGTTDNTVTKRELENRKVARRAAAEGMVLLKNEGILPLKEGTKIALYGVGASRTIKGGTGSGDVNERETVSIYKEIKNEENLFFKVHAFSHYFSKALGGVAFKDLDHTFDLALSIASMDVELLKSSFADLKKADMGTVRTFIDSLDDQAMTALSFIIKMAEIEPSLVHTEDL